MLIKEINIVDRPRERAINYGIGSLSNSELLAILFRTGTKDISALELGNQLLMNHSIHELKSASLHELTNISGIGNAKALSIMAAFELFKRTSVDSKKRVISPKDVYDYLKEDMTRLKQEHFVGIYLDVKNNIISTKTLFIGGLSTSVVHPREVFNWAVRLSAASIIIVHNHPSGDPTPSPSDVQVTVAMKEAGDLMDIQLIDHIIIGHSGFVSMKEIGKI